MEQENFLQHKLYMQSVGGCPWSRVVDVVNGQMIYETDESGQSIRNYNSHFKVANIPSDTRGYLIRTAVSTALVPSIKVGDKYLDLITMQEYTDIPYKRHTYGIIFTPKAMFNL